ncbi:hypothetical protein OHA99_09300 [Streptomyces coelicoflavus]|uniref:hypothetical protein n=1 Tax=Streptomyces coelicoflavus TaxID=285562 RepID=UPI003254828A
MTDPTTTDQTAAERIEQAEADAELHARNTEAVARERESYRAAWKDERRRRAGAEAELKHLRADRAAVLREAADHLDNSERLRDLTDGHMLDINAAANELRRMADETPAAETVGTLLATPCDACDHTLNWHRNDVGCTVPRCVCGRFQEPAAGARQRSRAARYLDAFLHRGPGYDLTPDQSAAGARQDGAQQPGLRERHRAAWNALTPDEQAARLAELDADDEEQP